MRTNWIPTLTLSAAVLLLTSAASAQSRDTAKIPFSFRVGTAEMPAGTYQIRPAIATLNVVEVTNGRDTKMALGRVAGYGDEKGARLVFSCRESIGCALTEIWYDDGMGVALPKPKLTSAEKERLAVIPLSRSSRAD